MYWQFFLENRGKVIGITAGIIFGLLFLLVGFFKTLVFAMFVAIGFYFGRKFDNQEDLAEILDRILPGKFTKH